MILTDAPSTESSLRLPEILSPGIQTLAGILDSHNIRIYPDTLVEECRDQMLQKLGRQRMCLCLLMCVAVLVFLSFIGMALDNPSLYFLSPVGVLWLGCMGWIAYHFSRDNGVVRLFGRNEWNVFPYSQLNTEGYLCGRRYVFRQRPNVEKLVELLRKKVPGVWFECEEVVSSVLPPEFRNSQIAFLWIVYDKRRLAVNPLYIPNIPD